MLEWLSVDPVITWKCLMEKDGIIIIIIIITHSTDRNQWPDMIPLSITRLLTKGLHSFYAGFSIPAPTEDNPQKGHKGINGKNEKQSLKWLSI